MDSAKKTIERILDGTGITINGNEAFDPQIHNMRFLCPGIETGVAGAG